MRLTVATTNLVTPSAEVDGVSEARSVALRVVAWCCS